MIVWEKRLEIHLCSVNYADDADRQLYNTRVFTAQNPNCKKSAFIFVFNLYWWAADRFILVLASLNWLQVLVTANDQTDNSTGDSGLII